MKRSNPQLSPRQVKIAVVTIICLFLYSAANAFLVYNAYAQLSEEGVPELIDIIDNWQTRAISDITISDSCPPDYEPAFRNFLWSGVAEGCWCANVPDATIKSEKITCDSFCKSSCTVRQSVLGCRTIFARDPQCLSHLADRSGTKVQICIKRSAETWNSAAIYSSQGCPQGYKQCGLSEDNIFCTKESMCPITDVTITSIPVADIPLCIAPDCMILEQTSSTAKKVEIKRGDTYDALPVSQFRLNEFAMCSVMTQDNITPGRNQFSLLNRKTSACYHFGELRWKPIDQIPEPKLFQINSLWTYISSLSPFNDPGKGLNGYYPVGQNENDFIWKLFSRRYIPFKRSCRNRMNDLVHSSNYIQELRSIHLGLMIIGFLATLGLGLVLCFLEIQDLRGIDMPCFSGQRQERSKKMKTAKNLLNYILKCIQLPFQIWAIVTVATAKSLFSSIVEEKCSDVQTHQTLALLSKNLEPTLNCDIIAIVILVVSVVLDLVLMIYTRKKENKRSNISYQEQDLAIADNSQIELRNAPDAVNISQLDIKSMIEDEQIPQSLKKTSTVLSINENSAVENAQSESHQDVKTIINNSNQLQSALEQFSEEYLTRKEAQAENLEQKESLHQQQQIPPDHLHQDEDPFS